MYVVMDSASDEMITSLGPRSASSSQQPAAAAAAEITSHRSETLSHAVDVIALRVAAVKMKFTVCYELPTSAANVALPACVAARRAAAPWRRPCSNRSISPTRRAHSSKPAARCCSGRTGQTDRRTDTVPLHGLCCAYYVCCVDKSVSVCTLHPE